ncbi:hypothetical protein GCM10010405_49770 [Streptomyces macrosporus]|uniref:Transposase n=1 Tax=Streptomyces macrosporus TaxID=44032 RepID=A0ABP5XLP2_9ACTN
MSVRYGRVQLCPPLPHRPPASKPGHRSRLLYRPRRDDDRRDERKSFSWRDYRDLLTTAHHRLGGSIVLIWDNLNVHTRPPSYGSGRQPGTG